MWFIYISIGALFIHLYRKDYISLPENLSYAFLSLSLVFLFAGFLLQALSYKLVLKSYGYTIKSRDTIIAFGLTVLSRYIPGKFWIHLGRGEYIRKRYDYPFGELVYISLYTQFLGMWNVLFFCSLGIFFLDIEWYIRVIILLAGLVLSVIIFTTYFHSLSGKIVKKALQKEVSIPALSFRQNLKVIPVFFVFWLLYALGFYFLALSMDVVLPPLGIIYFPLSTVLGIAAVFAPGGLGLREASLVGLLTLGSVATVAATTLAALSRIWFLAGELFAFALALLLKGAEKWSRRRD
ncbi:MAG: lysylphosphatidylglycerol synthase domain-containing protein [bacterium]